MWSAGDPVNREELDAPVPEPSAGLLALAGILALSVIRFRCAKKA